MALRCCFVAWTTRRSALWLEDGVREDASGAVSFLAFERFDLSWMRRMLLWLQGGIGEGACEPLGEAVAESFSKACNRAWRRHTGFLLEHGNGGEAPKASGEAVGGEDGGGRKIDSCSVRDSWTLPSGMLLVFQESWMLLVDMSPTQR